MNLYQDARRVPVLEQLFYSVWLFSIFMPVDALQPLRYACILGLLALFFVYRNDSLPLLLKSWPLLVLPLFACLSIFWTPYPGDAVRQGVLLVLSPILLVVLASRLRAAEFIRVTMFAGWLGTLYTIPFFSTLSEGGPYEQKNILAFHMMLVILVSFATALNEEELAPLRLIAAVFVPVAFYFQLLADSATSLIFAVAGTIGLLLVKLVWANASKVRHMRTVIVSVTFAGSLLIWFILLSTPNAVGIDDFLDLVGKDSSLTGRTALWEAAERISAERPLFGLGIEGFWNPASGLAQTLNENDFKAYGTKHSFHSAYWEVRVHYGLFGLGVFISVLAWTAIRTCRLWLKNGNLVNSTLLLMFLVIFISSFTESYVLGANNMMVCFLYFGGLAAFGVGERKLLGTARLVEQPD